MSAVEVERVARGRGLAEFIDFPYRLHARNPAWVPPLRRDVRRLLVKGRDPFHEHAEVACFLARRAGRTVGRVAAVEDRRHEEVHEDGAGFFGFFECEDDAEAARVLLAAAAAWLRARGKERIRGPASPSMNHECGCLVDSFDRPPALLMAWNPPYYPALIEGAGLAKVRDLLAFEGGDEAVATTPIPERLARALDVVRKRQGVTIRPLDRGDFAGEVARIRELFAAAWERNWGFVPMTDREIEHMARELEPVVVPELAPFAEIGGKPVGFALALPDLNVALRENHGGRFLPGMARVLWHLHVRRVRRIRILLLGLRPECRGKGIDALLYQWIWARCLERGIRWAEASWILEDNTAMRLALEKMGFRVYRRYRMYEAPIADLALAPPRPGTAGAPPP